MSKATHWASAALLLAGMGAGYVWFAPQMPAQVAQHFSGSGAPDGFVAADTFWIFSAVMVGFMMLCMHGITLVLPRISPSLINVPNKAHWLSPAQHAASIEYLQRWLLGYGNFTLAFMAFVMWRVVVANVQRSNLTGFVPGLALFGLVTVVALVALVRRFGAPKA